MSAPVVLVINAGSSSLKYQVVDPATGESSASGTVERIGEPGSPVSDHLAAFQVMQDAVADVLADADLLAVGHRVVHGGADFSAPTLIDDDVLSTVRRLVPLAPLHNPGNLQGIEVARTSFPDVPQVAVFDTAFHATMPPAAYTYAVPREWRTQYRVRKYGFHGTSHAFVSRRALSLLGDPSARVVVLHLGNGASACAVADGKSVDTSMGLSPLSGLVMGTRPGDVDPGLPGHLARVADMDLDTYERQLSKESGLAGLAGVSDFRELMARRADGDDDARLAFDVVAHRLVFHAAGLAGVLGGLDALVFTGGIGEHSPELRAAVVGQLGFLGLTLDEAANDAAHSEATITQDGPSTAFVIPTNEEWEIARAAAALVAPGQSV